MNLYAEDIYGKSSVLQVNIQYISSCYMVGLYGL